MVVENSYGRLKGRWRCLLKRLDFKLKNVPYVVSACFFNIISVKCMATHVLRNGRFRKWNGQFRNMHVYHHAQLLQIMMELMDLVQVYAMLL